MSPVSLSAGSRRCTPLVLSLATLWIAGLLGVTLLFVVVAPSALTRSLALDTLTLILIAFLALSIHGAGSSYALDAALVLALLSIVRTLAARYHRRGGLFR